MAGHPDLCGPDQSTPAPQSLEPPAATRSSGIGHLLSMQNEVVLLRSQELGRGTDGLSECEVWPRGSHGAEKKGLMYLHVDGFGGERERSAMNTHRPGKY